MRTLIMPLVISAAFALTTNTVFAANEHVCVEVVAWKDLIANTTGHSQLGTSNVSGATIGDAASDCHKNARAAFVANAAWSVPNQICANTDGRNFKTPVKVSVWAVDQFQGGVNWNIVETYTVDCALTGGVPLP